MGHCLRCRDPNLDQRILRKKRKVQFRFDLRNDQKKSEIERRHCTLPDDVNYDATICKYCLDCNK